MEVLVIILSHLHILDIFPLKMAGSRRITNVIRIYFPLPRSEMAYLQAVGLVKGAFV